MMPRNGPRKRTRVVTFWSLTLALVCWPSLARPIDDDDIVLGRRLGIGFEEVTALDFGTVARGTGYVAIDPYDAVAANPNYLWVDPSVTSGVLQITGDGNRAFSLDITGRTMQGMTMSHFETNYGSPPLTGLQLDSGGNRTITIGARLTIDPSSTPIGEVPLLYDIVVVYE